MTLKLDGNIMLANGHSIYTNGAPSPANHHTYKVEVYAKAGFADAAGAALLTQLPLIGIQSVREIRIGTIYELTGRISPSQATAAANQLLADPVTQEHYINNGKALASQLGSHWRIEVWLKPSVTDPIGDSVRKAMSDLGLPAPETVRCASVYKLIGRLSQSQAEKIASKLLVNPVIHRFSIESC